MTGSQPARTSRAAQGTAISFFCLWSQVEHMALVEHLQGFRIQTSAGQRRAALTLSLIFPIRLGFRDLVNPDARSPQHWAELRSQRRVAARQNFPASAGLSLQFSEVRLGLMLYFCPASPENYWFFPSTSRDNNSNYLLRHISQYTCGKGHLLSCYHLPSSKSTLSFLCTTSVHTGEHKYPQNRATAGLWAPTWAQVSLTVSAIPWRCRLPSLLQAGWTQSHITKSNTKTTGRKERRQNGFSPFFPPHLTYVSTKKSLYKHV